MLITKRYFKKSIGFIIAVIFIGSVSIKVEKDRELY